MNDLELPPRRTLPPEVRDRIRTTVDAETPRPRYRAPLVAAAVAVLAAGAVIVGQSSDGYRPATPPPSTGTTVPGSDPVLTVTAPDAQSSIDLDRCWVAIEASQRTGEYAPRSTWQPVFTVTRARPGGGGAGIDEGSLVRVTAFRDPGGRPGFCEATEVIGEDRSKRRWMATVSDPSAEPIPLATGINGEFFNTGLLAGVAEGVDAVEFAATNPHPDTGEPIRYETPAVLRDGLFLVEVGGLHVPGSVEVTGFDSAGDEVVSGEWTYDPAKDPMAGPSKIVD